MSNISRSDKVQRVPSVARKTIIVTSCLNTTPGTGINTNGDIAFTINIRDTPYNVNFTPDHVIVKQVMYSNWVYTGTTATTDSGIFLITSDIPNAEQFALAYVGTQGVSSNPLSDMVYKFSQTQINFTVSTTAPTTGSQIGPNGILAMTLEFTKENM